MPENESSTLIVRIGASRSVTEPRGDEEAEQAAGSDLDLLGDFSFLRAAHLAVPAIGHGHRWYDYPYKMASGLAYSKIGRRSPRRFRLWLIRFMTYLIPWHELDRAKAWSREDPTHNLFVPEDEHVHLPGIWVAEFFPPSEIAS